LNDKLLPVFTNSRRSTIRSHSPHNLGYPLLPKLPQQSPHAAIAEAQLLSNRSLPFYVTRLIGCCQQLLQYTQSLLFLSAQGAQPLVSFILIRHRRSVGDRPLFSFHTYPH
jgi:hypothetical protein